MIPLKNALWVLCGLALAAPVSAQTFRPLYAAGDWTRLSLRQDVVYRRDTTSPAEDGAAARESQETQNLGIELVFRSLSKRADGSRDMEVAYRRKWRQTWRDGGAPAVADYSSVAGRSMTFRLLADGTVEGLKGHETFPEIVDPATLRPISRSDFVHDILYLFPRFPAEPVSIGSTWDAPVFVLPNSPRPPTIYHYKVLDRVNKDGEDCLRIVATHKESGSMERPAPEGGTARVEAASQGIAVYYFSLKKGMIVGKSLSWQGTQKNHREGRLPDTARTIAMYECSVKFN